MLGSIQERVEGLSVASRGGSGGRGLVKGRGDVGLGGREGHTCLEFKMKHTSQTQLLVFGEIGLSVHWQINQAWQSYAIFELARCVCCLSVSPCLTLTHLHTISLGAVS